MYDTKYTLRFVSGRPHEADPEFYLKDYYWDKISKARVVVDLNSNELVRKIVAEAHRRGIPITGETPEIEAQLKEFLKSAAP